MTTKKQRDLVAEIRAEMTPGGTPLALYLATGAHRILNLPDQYLMTNEIFRDLERRLVDVETHIIGAIRRPT